VKHTVQGTASTDHWGSGITLGNHRIISRCDPKNMNRSHHKTLDEDIRPGRNPHGCPSFVSRTDHALTSPMISITTTLTPTLFTPSLGTDTRCLNPPAMLFKPSLNLVPATLNAPRTAGLFMRMVICSLMVPSLFTLSYPNQTQPYRRTEDTTPCNSRSTLS